MFHDTICQIDIPARRAPIVSYCPKLLTMIGEPATDRAGGNPVTRRTAERHCGTRTSRRAARSRSNPERVRVGCHRRTRSVKGNNSGSNHCRHSP